MVLVRSKRKANSGPPPEMGEGSKLSSLPGFVSRALTRVDPANELCPDLRANYDSCSISIIPEHIYKNEELVCLLTELTARNNVISKMQPYIDLCSRLCKLDLSNNLLKGIPVEVTNIVTLESVNFSDNRLRRCPKFHKLPKLTTVEMARNRIKKLGGNLFTGSSIDYYDFSHNELTFLPKQIYRRPIRVDASHNKIKKLPQVPVKGTSHLNHLDASHNQLTTLPVRCQTLACLATLNLSHNQVEVVEDLIIVSTVKKGEIHKSEHMVYLPYYLTDVNLSFNKIREIGNKIAKLRGLRNLNLSNNRLEHIPEGFRKLSCMRTLDLSNNFIENIEGRLHTMHSLTRLDLSQNQIEQVASVWKLHRCEILDISHNKVASIPEDVCNMQDLKELLVSHNLIKTVPEGIGELSRLKTLKLDHNKISEIPHTLGVAQLLHCLDLSYNDISYLPPDLRRWRTVEMLNLKGNSITAVPKNFHLSFVRLTELDVSENSIQELIIPKSVGSLSLGGNPLNLIEKVLNVRLIMQKLFLTNLGLQELPTHTAHFRTLEHLDVSNNSLSVLAGDVISHLRNLRWLDCSHNELTELPAELTSLPNLKRLDCSYNRIQRLNRDLLHCPLAYLDASHNELSSVDIQDVRPSIRTQDTTAFKLTYLDVSYNQIAEFLRDNLHSFASLETVNASHNYITWIHPHVTYLYRLKMVDFSHNDLLLLPPAFDRMKRLETLNLKENLLQRIPESFCKLSAIKSLDVSSNKIFEWPNKWPKFLLTNKGVYYDKQRSVKRSPKYPPPDVDEVVLLMSGKSASASIKVGKSTENARKRDVIAMFQRELKKKKQS